MKKRSNLYLKILLSLFVLIWIILAINPRYRSVWVAENLLVVLIVPLLVLSYKKFKFSNLSYTFIFTFLVFHLFGAYYSYSEVPLFEILKSTFDLSRNHYDRVVHFLFGVLIFFPVNEFLINKLKIKKGWSLFLSFLVINCFGGIFELIEWGAVLFANSDIVLSNYLGMQGDVWDAQKDMFLVLIGSFISMSYIWIKNKLS